MARKGAVTITLSSDKVDTGDTVRGSVTVTSKKELQASRLWVALVAEADDGTDFEGARDWQAWHRDEVDLDAGRTWAPGSEATFEFEFAVPAPPPVPEEPDDEAGWLKKRSRKKAARDHDRRKRRYRVEARLEVRGLDLKDTAPLTVDGQKYRRALKA